VNLRKRRCHRFKLKNVSAAFFLITTGILQLITASSLSCSYIKPNNYSALLFSSRLTAFVVRSYARARKYVFIDDDEIKHSIKWFGTKQKPSGCFLNYGRVFDRSLQASIL
jgi:hypothetical protein